MRYNNYQADSVQRFTSGTALAVGLALLILMSASLMPQLAQAQSMTGINIGETMDDIIEDSPFGYGGGGSPPSPPEIGNNFLDRFSSRIFTQFRSIISRFFGN